ncbi:hypothetical protein D3C76_965410 [compost metagenome]
MGAEQHQDVDFSELVALRFVDVDVREYVARPKDLRQSLDGELLGKHASMLHRSADIGFVFAHPIKRRLIQRLNETVDIEQQVVTLWSTGEGGGVGNIEVVQRRELFISRVRWNREGCQNLLHERRVHVRLIRDILSRERIARQKRPSVRGGFPHCLQRRDCLLVLQPRNRINDVMGVTD